VGHRLAGVAAGHGFSRDVPPRLIPLFDFAECPHASSYQTAAEVGAIQVTGGAHHVVSH